MDKAGKGKAMVANFVFDQKTNLYMDKAEKKKAIVANLVFDHQKTIV